MRGAMARTADARGVMALARKASIQRATIYAWWKGRPPRPGHLEAAAQALDEPVGALWGAWGGRPATEPEWFEAIQTAVAAGVTDGVAQAIEALRAEGLLGPPGTSGGRLPRRRSV
jgi:transcriptional regulator with XRE-family HTH domain